MRRVSLAIAAVGFAVMACACGGARQNKPIVQIAAEKPQLDGPGDDTANPAAIAAYAQFPEPHKGDLIRDWKRETAAVRKAIESDKAALSRAASAVEREKLSKLISIRTARLARLQKNDPPYVTRQAAERVAEYQEKTDDKEISEARAKRKANAEAEAEAREEASRKAYEAAMEEARRAYEKGVEKYKAEPTLANAMKILRAAQRDYDAAREKAMKARETAKAIVYPPDPVAKAVADAASRSEIAMAADAAALRRAEDEAVLRAQKTAPSDSPFVGRWKLLNEKGVVCAYITVGKTLDAKRHHAPDAPGRWGVVGNEARFSWADGFRDITRQGNDGTITYLGLGREAAGWDSPPQLTLRAIRITTDAQAGTEKKAEPSAEKVTRANYQRLSDGISLAEAQGILGPAKELSRSGGAQVVSWSSAGIFPTVITATFFNGRLQSKAIIGD